MFHKLILVFMPIGILLALLISSFNGYQILAEFAQLLTPDHDNSANLALSSAFGELSLSLFGIGLIYAAMLRQEPSPLKTYALIGATSCFAIACMAIGFGNWILISAFQSLATAETIDAVRYSDSLRGATAPLLIGWCFALIGAALVFISRAFVKKESKLAPNFSKTAWLAVSAFFIFSVSSCYIVWKYLALYTVVADGPTYDPAVLASGVNGVLLGRFATILGFAISGVISALMIRTAKTNKSR